MIQYPGALWFHWEGPIYHKADFVIVWVSTKELQRFHYKLELAEFGDHFKRYQFWW